jgi:uncharacterized lipoprotein YbaY
MKTPVAFFIFRRPDTTEKVFEAIRQAKPSKLFVVADGPRPDRPGEAEKCAATRAIIDRVDWDCEVIKNYSDVNLSARIRVSSGLDWVFERVEEAILLEDDCLPNPSFFPFCETLLDWYREDKRIMMISGTNWLGEWKSDLQSYHFSYYGGIWGWASWRRAWQYYDVNMKLWQNQEARNRIKDILANNYHYKVRANNFDATYSKKVDAWDYQWSLARLLQSGLSIVPCVNLISNIGFGEDATNTKSANSIVANLQTEKLEFPLKFNTITVVDRDYDKVLFQKITNSVQLSARIKTKLTKVIQKVKSLSQ